ncbi:follistatin-A-like [Oppia nitens]|uniref:follistatin-A-like n=1 Tax=Oppia nitens TaxID=1686743 RepID=UPI0023D9F540|nr:follistatin-A-like [Oppia nitens]
MCWSSPKNGRCTELLKTGVTEDECCNGVDSHNSGIGATAYSAEDLKGGQLFYYRALRGGVPCNSCKASCDGIECKAGRKCVVNRDGQPECVCAPKCSRRKRKMGPVCGSDGQTYRHICRLLKRKCRKDSTLTVEYYGNCEESCDRVGCSENKTCIIDQNLRPHCVRCRHYCPPISANTRPVCGIDNITYSSYCHLQTQACLSGRAIQVAYRGHCKREANCQSITCSQNKKCLTDRVNGGGARCVTCPMGCPKHLAINQDLMTNKMICASNNMTYLNWCSMMKEGCNTGNYLYVVSSGPCPQYDGLTVNMIDDPNKFFKKAIVKINKYDKFDAKR